MHRLPPMTGLRAFEAVARHLSFKLAADELGVTPTAISHQIRLLEHYTGQRLFRRRPRPLALTAAGVRLFPVINDGFMRFAEVLKDIGASPQNIPLKVTTTSAFAARWLLPKLSLWRHKHPSVSLDIISTYDVLNLDAGEADVAIRYARNPPQDGVASELFRDTFYVVGSPMLVGSGDVSLSPEQMLGFALIETGWPERDMAAPTWQTWEAKAGKTLGLAGRVSLRFEEELHAIEAAIAGQGLAICSDILAAQELRNGQLWRVSAITLPGYGFYLVYRRQHPRLAAIMAFAEWMRLMAEPPNPA